MSKRQELLAATDETIDDAVKYADPMVLRGLLYQLTGDEEVANIELTSDMFLHLKIHRIAKESDIALLQSKAATFLKNYRDNGAGNMDLGPAERLYRSLGLAAGEEIPGSEREMWLEQTALDPWVRGLKWKGQTPSAEQRQGFIVGVVGAGLSGLNAAVQLKRAGIPYIVFEKNPEVGGTWYENVYPGARVDSPSRSYTHLFGVNFPYPYNYCPQEENLRYFKWVADNFEVRENIKFDTEVKSARWDEDTQQWELTAEGPEGLSSWRVNAVICCVGFLSRPEMPRIKGMDSFKGTACHTARWPRGLDIKGKRVAVIGTGASGYQTAPEIAKVAAHTYIFQRTPSWCMANSTYLRPLPLQVNWLERNFPYLVNFSRFRLAWFYGPEPVFAAARVDPEFNDPHARSSANKKLRDHCVAFIRKKLASRPELIEKMIPEAPPLSSRPITIDEEDNIYDALLKDNVTLVTDRIGQITANGIEAGDREYPVDVILYATGFKANDFLWPMELRGRNGARVEELWKKDGARAYLGAMVPGLPNFFMIYGPNSNNWGGLHVIDLLELVSRFALECIGGMIAQKKRSVDVTIDAYSRFNDELDRSEARMIYKDSRANNYYKNSFGRSAVNGPIDIRRMWHWLRDPSAPPPHETAPGIRPYFGEDLVVRS
jgi:4-hydroxyacetophenone monooxygenase